MSVMTPLDDYNEVQLVVKITVEVLDSDYQTAGEMTLAEVVNWEPGSTVGEQIASTTADLTGQFSVALDARCFRVAGLGS